MAHYTLPHFQKQHMHLPFVKGMLRQIHQSMLIHELDQYQYLALSQTLALYRYQHFGIILTSGYSATIATPLALKFHPNVDYPNYLWAYHHYKYIPHHLLNEQWTSS